MQNTLSDKELNVSLAKFNRMYENVSTKFSNKDEVSIVFNYGTNMKKMYPDFFTENSFDEVSQKLTSLNNILNDLEEYQC